jgi:hypothetical protein
MNRSGPTVNTPTTTNRPGITTNNPTGSHPGVTTNNPTGSHPGVTTNNPAGSHPNPMTGGFAGPRPPTSGGSGFGHNTVNMGNGRISDFHDARRGMDVHNGLSGGRRVTVERPDHSRVFAERGRPGFVQHPYSFRNHDFGRRTYYYHGRAYDRFYRPYHFHNVAIDVYAPVRYYPVGFYGWAYNPWYHPVVYTWGWGPSPWVGYYGYYFTPYGTYPSAPYWLTDYMISQDLAAEYQAAQENQSLGPAQSAGAAQELTPEVKQQIADEVRFQIALENSEAQQNAQNQDVDPGSSGIARLLSDGHTHVFVAGSDLDVVDTSGTECALSGGDVLQLTAPPPADAEAADLVVLSSKGGQECPKSDTVTVALNDLQDMQNHMRETIDQGLQELQAKQGTGGLPQAPPSAQAPPVETAFAQGAPPPDPNGATEVNQQLQQADAAEQDVVSQAQQESGAAAAPPPSAAPVTISLGQTIDQVTNTLGQPVRVIDLGTKKIYQHEDMKITFNDGKVTDVQ